MQNIIIPRYANLVCHELGHDSPQHAGPMFSRFGNINYKFNAHGYRTHEFSKLDSDSVLVFGDSFTLGLGVNSENRYTDLLEQQLGSLVFNISLNGASNDWIARRVVDFLNIVTPRAIIVHYTFSHRREHNDTTWHDDERTLCEPTHSDQENYENWQQNFNSVSSAYAGPLIHSFIPNWHEPVVDYSTMPGAILTPCKSLDVARDGFHYGIKTHQLLAQRFAEFLATLF